MGTHPIFESDFDCLTVCVFIQEDLKIGNMKLLENINFEALSEALTTEDCLDGRIDARIESYSCKMTSNDKKFLGRAVTKRGVSPHDLAALSPPTTAAAPAPTSRIRTWS